MTELRGGLIGCGFFARNHVLGWQEVDGARITAVCDRERSKADAYGSEFGIAGVYDDAAAMIAAEDLDFIDIATHADSHRTLVELAAEHRLPVICQKPLAASLAEAETMVVACETAGVPFMVHENFRWQTPMRAVQAAAAEIGEIFYCRIASRSVFDVYTDQPYLKAFRRFIIYEAGIHYLDLARFFMGEMDRVYCQTQRIHPDIQGEDVATILLQSARGATCLVEMSFSSRLPHGNLPQTEVTLEGSGGSVSLGRDYVLTVTTPAGTTERTVAPRHYSWTVTPGEYRADSVVAIQRHWLERYRAGREPETTGRDNLRTLALVFGAYESAESGQPWRVGEKRSQNGFPPARE